MPEMLPSGFVPLSHNDQDLKKEYYLALDYLEKNFPYKSSFKGKINPYTSNAIWSKRDYDEYLRQYALRLAYEKLFSESQYGELYFSAKEDFERQISFLNAENNRLTIDGQTQGGEIKRLEAEKKHLNEKLWRRSAAGILLAVILLFGVIMYLPDARRSSYEEGKTDGYTAGHEAGYSSGYESGNQNAILNSNTTSTITTHTFGSSAKQNNLSSSTRPSTTSDNQFSTVYVSRNGVIHRQSNCSGMKYYTEMGYSDAIAAGYRLCSKCY